MRTTGCHTPSTGTGMIFSPSNMAFSFAALGKKFAEAMETAWKSGSISERKKGEIGISSIRLADVIGDHSVIFGGLGERIELTHRSTSRKNYALGALRAAKFVDGKKKGFFNLSDVLGLV